MATHTFGTSASSSLTAVKWFPGQGSGISNADMATIAEAIWFQDNKNPTPIPGAFSFNGLLFLPGNRGVIQPKPGDVVAVDTNFGWPIVVSKEALGAGSSPWVFT